MAAVGTTRKPIAVIEREFTVADLVCLPSELASGPVDYELDNGRLIPMSPPGEEHGAVESNFCTVLKVQGEFAGHGKVRVGEVGIVLWRNPDRVVGADVVFIANAQLPTRVSPEGYLETIPDLVVEVLSKNDTREYVRRKVQDYLTAGVRVVLVADPATRTVSAHRRAQEIERFGEGDSITVPDVLASFIIPVADAFRL